MMWRLNESQRSRWSKPEEWGIPSAPSAHLHCDITPDPSAPTLPVADTKTCKKCTRLIKHFISCCLESILCSVLAIVDKNRCCCFQTSVAFRISFLCVLKTWLKVSCRLTFSACNEGTFTGQSDVCRVPSSSAACSSSKSRTEGL